MPSRRSVRDTYDRIASHFSKTRARPWEEVVEFLDGRAGEIGLDLGCGNGRHTVLVAERTDRTIGLDLSRGSLREAASTLSETGNTWLVQGDAGSIPLRSDSVDLAVYVATIHHLPDREIRIASLDELDRVLDSDGVALVSAWSVTHDRFDRSEAFDTTVDWTLPDGEVVPRYYHVYDLDSFRDDLEESGLAVDSVFESGGNCYGIVEG